MRILFLASLILFLAYSDASAQKLKPVSFYLAHPKVSKTAKDFYKKLPAYRNNSSLYYNNVNIESITASIMDSVLSSNNETRPFYLYLMNRNMDLADGALQLLVMMHQYKIFQIRPEVFFRYMLDNPGEKKAYLDKWVRSMSLFTEQYCHNNPSDNPEGCMTGFRKKVVDLLIKNDMGLAGFASDYFTLMGIPPGLPPQITIGIEENGRNIRCLEGTIIEARFRECRGCGSVWEASYSNPQMIRQDKIEFSGPSCYNCTGGSHTRHIYFTITGKGKTSLVFTYFDQTVSVNFTAY